MTAIKALPLWHLQAILQLPALKTFVCHGFVCTIQQTCQTTEPRDIISVHLEQRHQNDRQWLECLLAVCPDLEALSIMTHSHSHDHNSTEYTMIGDTLRTHGQHLVHLKLENKYKTDVDDTCIDKMPALGSLEALASLQTLSVHRSLEVEFSKPVCWSCIRVF